MKVVILGDSFGLPRWFKNSKEIEINFEDTYPEKLRQLLKKEFNQEDIAMVNMCKRFNNSLFLIQKEFSEVYLIQPEYLIIQVGIVDCWSREDGSCICEEFRGKNPWITEDEYISYLRKFIMNCFQQISSLKFIIVVNITKTKESQYEKHSGSFERTLNYNKKLETLKDIGRVYVADVYEKFNKELKKTVSSDGVHPSSYGNYVIAQKIFEIITSEIYLRKGIQSLNNDNENSINYFRKVCEYMRIESLSYWKALSNLIELYINNRNYEELNNIIILEAFDKNILQNNEEYKQMISFLCQKLIEDKNIEFEYIKEKYFKFLECLIELKEFELFNNIIAKFVGKYDCISYEKHGKLMVKYGLDELATESFIKAIELNSTNSKIYSYIAKRFLEIEEVEDSLEFAIIALNMDKKNMEAYDIVINGYNAIGEFDKANEFKILKNKNNLVNRKQEKNEEFKNN